MAVVNRIPDGLGSTYNGTSVTVPRPSAVVDGDLIVFEAAKRATGSQTLTPPPGFALIGEISSGNLSTTYLYSKVVGSETSWLWQGTQSTMQYVLLGSYAQCKTSTPTIVGTASASALSISLPSVAGVSGGMLVTGVHIADDDAYTGTPASPWVTMATAAVTAGGSRARAHAGQQPLSADGATGTRTFTNTTSTNQTGVVAVIEPTATAPEPTAVEPPTALTVVAESADALRLAWTDSTTPGVTYVIRRLEGSTPPASPTDGVLVAEVESGTWTWEENFTRLDLASSSNPGGRWRANDVWQPVDEGYVDFGSGGSTWNLNPNEDIGGAPRSAFSVANGVLTITARRIPDEWRADIDAKGGAGTTWAGGILITNTDDPALRFGYGYYAIRARWPDFGRGMFPALWMFAANGQNVGKENAEIDLFEIFGYGGGRPWDITLHEKQQGGTPATGATTADGQVNVATIDSSTADWHVYGVDWTADYLRFYRDDVLVAEVTGASATFFQGVSMSLRLNYAMDAAWFPAERLSDATTPDTLTMEVDWIRRWDAKPAAEVPAGVIVDDFNTQNTDLWTGWSSGGAGGPYIRVADGYVEIDAASGYPTIETLTTQDITAHDFVVEITQLPALSGGATSARMEVAVDVNNRWIFGWTNDGAYLERHVGGVKQPDAYGTWPAGTRYIRATYDGANAVLFQTSLDGITWALPNTTGFSRPVDELGATTSFRLRLSAGNWNSVASPGSMRVTRVGPVQ